MKESLDSVSNAGHGERGAARIKFIIILAVVAIIGYMGFQMVPVWYQSSTFKKAMDDSAEMTAASGKSGEWLGSQIKASAKEYCAAPCSLTISQPPAIRDGRWSVTVAVKRPVNILPAWTYNYEFEYTAQSRTFVNPQ